MRKSAEPIPVYLCNRSNGRTCRGITLPTITANMKVSKDLFRCLTQFWQLNTLEKSGVEFGNREMTLGGFGTREYVSSSHVDVKDSRYTLGIGFYRGRQNPTMLTNSATLPRK